MTPTDPPPRPFDNRYGYVIACLPFVVLGTLIVATPTFLDPIYDNPPAMFGLPAGVVLLGAGIVWGALAFVVIWAASSRIGVLVAELFFTLPALFAIILTAPVVLILQRFSHI